MSNNSRTVPNGFNVRPGRNINSALDFHGTPLTVSWLLIIDLAVFVAAIRWHKYSSYIHAILALLVVGLTLGASIPLLKQNFLINQNARYQFVNVHRVTGFIVVLWMGFQLILGIFSRVIQFFPIVKPIVCLWVKRFHLISGYLLMIGAKFNYLNIKFRPNK